MTVVPILANNAFDSETTEVLGAAFEAAWQAAKASDGTLADHAQAATTRNMLGKRIIEMARRGERNQSRLVQDALHHLAKSKDGADATDD